MKPLVLAVALAAAASPAVAQTQVDLTRSTAGYTYFNQPGATPQAHDEAVRSCLKEARATSQPDTSAGAPAGGGLLSALVVGMVKGFMDGMQERRGVAANMENCMVVRGWRVVKLDDAQGLGLADLAQPALAQALSAYVGAETPPGTVERVFGNEIANGDARTNLPSGDLDKPSLSLVALPKLEPEPRTERPKPPRMARSARPPSALKPEQIKLTPDAALIVVRLTGTGQQGGEGLMFVREGKDADTPAWVDGRPASFDARLPGRFFKRAGEQLDSTLAFSVPPGRWRLAAIQSGLFGTAFCLGAPAFDVAAGEAVFAGSFALDTGLVPDTATAPATAALAKSPEAAQRLRPAAYVNGSTAACGGAYIYALEAPGAPFQEGYVLGSRARPATASLTASPPLATPTPQSGAPIEAAVQPAPVTP